MRNGVWYTVSLLFRMAKAILKYTGSDKGILTALECGLNLDPTIFGLNLEPTIFGHPIISELQDLKGIYNDGKRMVQHYRNYANADPRKFVKTLWEKFAGQVIDFDYRNEKYHLHIP